MGAEEETALVEIRSVVESYHGGRRGEGSAEVSGESYHGGGEALVVETRSVVESYHGGRREGDEGWRGKDACRLAHGWRGEQKRQNWWRQGKRKSFRGAGQRGSGRWGEL